LTNLEYYSWVLRWQEIREKALTMFLNDKISKPMAQRSVALANCQIKILYNWRMRKKAIIDGSE